MLRSIHSIQGFQIGASNGAIGAVDAAYVDDAYRTTRDEPRTPHADS